MNFLRIYDTSCRPTTQPQTFLFAYSNDLSPKTVLDTWSSFYYYKYDIKYSWFGSVRFDVPNVDIKFHSNIRDVNATIQYNLPDPNQGFQNYSIGSNVFDVIENLFSNTEAPVCGSIIFILLKRYPNEADTSRLVSLIRSHHAVVHVITSATPSGGTQPKAMYSVASKTNAMAAFEYDYHFGDTIGWFPIFNTLYPVYATTIQVSGSGTKTLPNFHPPIELQYLILISYQDHVPDDSFQSLTLRWANPRDSGNFRFDSGDVSDHWGNGTIAIQWGNFLNVDYNITLDYTYSGHDVQNLQIRIYSWIPLHNWLPYSD
ncbi:unnamed protein product [Caenorhabditis nigoni]